MTRASGGEDRQAGATSPEYVAILLVIAGLVAVVVGLALDDRVDETGQLATCQLFEQSGTCVDATGQAGGEGGSGGPGGPTRPGGPPLGGDGTLGPGGPWGPGDPPVGGQPDPVDGPDETPAVPPRDSGLTELLDDVAGDDLTTEEYQELAADHVRGLLPEDDPDNIYGRNEAITQAYAELYFADPETFKWAGMAAFASELVGDGIGQAERARVSNIPIVPGLADFSFTDLSLSLQFGNARVFSDIYWQHLAYEDGGMAAVERAHDDGALPTSVLQAWRDIDEGRTTGNQDLVWQGNQGLLFHEQAVTLQEGVYDPSRRMYEQLSSEAIGLIIGLQSPIPGHDETFQDFHSHGDIGDFDDRWAWITDSMLPAWRDREADLTDELAELME